MLNTLTRRLLQTNEDPAVRCVILTGNGRTFCAGLDLRQNRPEGAIRPASLPTTLDLRNTRPRCCRRWTSRPSARSHGMVITLIFAGSTLSAHESLDWGLANLVVPDAELTDRALAMAREIAANALLAMQAAKQMMRMGLDETCPDRGTPVYLAPLPLFKTRDMAEGMAAFMAKRPPQFTGQ